MENSNWNRYIYSSVHCSTIYGSQDTETPKCPPGEEHIKKIWHIYTMGFNSAITKNEIMAFAATRVDLEIIIRSEVSQTQKDLYAIT